MPSFNSGLRTAKSVTGVLKPVTHPTNLKSVTANVGAGNKGLTTTENYAKPSSVFHTGATSTRTTTSNPMGQGARTSVQNTKGKLTKTGKVTVGATTATAYGGGLVALNNKTKVKKNMDTVSYWGIDHGEEISKLSSQAQKRKVQLGAITGAGIGSTTGFVASGGRAIPAVVGGALGAGAGGAVGFAKTNKKRKRT